MKEIKAIIQSSVLDKVLLARQFALDPARPAPDFRTFGQPGAPVEIEEYSDFACGACRAAAGKLEEVFNGLRREGRQDGCWYNKTGRGHGHDRQQRPETPGAHGGGQAKERHRLAGLTAVTFSRLVRHI